MSDDYTDIPTMTLRRIREDIDRELDRRVTWKVTKKGDDPNCKHPSDRHSTGMTGSKALCIECGAWLVVEDEQ
jgi:hypothetical protein